jgi:hypothetical protein
MVVKGGIARHLLWLVIHPKRGKPGFNFAPGAVKMCDFHIFTCRKDLFSHISLRFAILHIKNPDFLSGNMIL